MTIKLPIPSIAALMFALAPAASRAQIAPNPVIVFTEESSTVLTATVGGGAFGTVSPLGPNDWLWVLPADRPFIDVTRLTAQTVFWLEPENQNQVNAVQKILFQQAQGLAGGMHITSDSPIAGATALQNGATSLDSFTYPYVGGASETFSVQFIDRGDAGNTVPDNSSTLGMLFLSAAVIFGAARLRTPRAS